MKIASAYDACTPTFLPTQPGMKRIVVDTGDGFVWRGTLDGKPDSASYVSGYKLKNLADAIDWELFPKVIDSIPEEEGLAYLFDVGETWPWSLEFATSRQVALSTNLARAALLDANQAKPAMPIGCYPGLGHIDWPQSRHTLAEANDRLTWNYGLNGRMLQSAGLLDAVHYALAYGYRNPARPNDAREIEVGVREAVRVSRKPVLMIVSPEYWDGVTPVPANVTMETLRIGRDNGAVGAVAYKWTGFKPLTYPQIDLCDLVKDVFGAS